MLLGRLGARAELIKEVCDITGHHCHLWGEQSINFKIVYDADVISNVEGEQNEDPTGPESMTSVIEKSFSTESGRDLARHVLLKESRA